MKKDIFLYRYKRRKLKLTFSAPFTLFCESSILSAEFGAVRFEPVLSLDEPGGRITAPPLTTPVLTCCKKCPTLKLRSYLTSTQITYKMLLRNRRLRDLITCYYFINLFLWKFVFPTEKIIDQSKKVPYMGY